MLNLEGDNMNFGWHAYLFYQKHKNDNLFKHYILRHTLYAIWQKYKRYIGDQRPKWLVPMEIISSRTERRLEQKLTYKDLTY